MPNSITSEEMDKVIAVFEREVNSGYTCKDKKSKYAKDIDDHMDEWQWYNGRKYSFDWCTVFFDWCHIDALGVDRAREVLNRPKNSMGAGVRYSREYLKALGRVGNEPKVGCAVYFGDLPYPRHIGYVYKVTDTMIYTYEGNCYVSNGISGVKAKSYKRTNPDILDYGYPVYSTQPSPKELDGYKVGNTYQVHYDDLQIRKGPGENYQSIGQLNTDDLIVCAGLASDKNGSTWLEHKTGWSCGRKGTTRYIGEIKKSTGWVKKDDKWYYFDESGKMLRSAWTVYKGNLYYLGADGVMVEGWQTVGGYKYYFYPKEGHRANAEWIDGLFLDGSGRQLYDKKGTWKHNDKGWWFVDEYGWYPKSRSMMINRVEYEFDDHGYMIDK